MTSAHKLEAIVSVPPQLKRALPGAEFIAEGLDHLSAGRETEAALLVEIAAPRLRALGINLPAPDTHLQSPEHRLYELLSRHPGAHSRYNALLAKAASYARAAEHATTR
jgi:hypothetical protein